MKWAALGLLALVVLATAKPLERSMKIMSRQKRQTGSFDAGSFGAGSFDAGSVDAGSFGAGSTDFGSFDLGSFDMGSFDIGSFGSMDASEAGVLMGSLASSMLQGSTFGSFDVSNMDDVNGDEVFAQMGSTFSNMVSTLAGEVPDMMSDPIAFASYAAMMETQFDSLGNVGESILDQMFETQLTTGLSSMGITGFDDDMGMDTSAFIEQLDSDAWSTMSKIGDQKDMFNMNDMSSDDFMTLMDMSGDLGDANFNAFLSLKNDTSAMTPDQMANIPPELFAALDSAVLREMTNNMTSEQKMTICENMNYADPTTAGTLMGSVDCTDYYSTYGGMSLEMQMAMMESKAAATPMDQWSDSDWTQMLTISPGGIDPEDIDMMSDSAIMDNMGTFASQVGNMDEDDMFAIFDNIDDAINGDFANMQPSVFGQMGAMVTYMDIDDFMMIPPATKLASLDSFIGVDLGDEMAAEMAESVLDIMPPMDQWTAEDLGKCASFMMYDEDRLGEMNVNAVYGALDKLSSFEFDDTEAVTITDRFMDDATYGNPSNWNSSMIKSAGPLLAGFDTTFIDGLSANDVATALTTMNATVRNRMKLPKSTSRSIIEKMSTSLGGVANFNVSLLGNVVKGMISSEIAQLPGSQAGSAMKVFSNAYDDMDQSSRRAIVDMAIAGPGGLNAVFTDLGPFFGDLSLGEIDSLPYSSINPKSPPTNGDIDVMSTPAQSRRGWKNMVANFGNPSAAAGNWSLKMWKFIGPVKCGIPCSEIKKIPISNKFPSILSMFTTQEQGAYGCLNDAQINCMAKRVRQYYFKNNTDTLNYKRLTKTNLQKTAFYMAAMNLTDLSRLNNSVCQHVLNNIGKYELNKLPRSSLINLKNYLMNCTGKAASGEKVTAKELRSVGDLQCGIELSDVSKLDAKIFKNNVGKMLDRCPQYPVDVQDALVENMMQANNISVTDFNITESKMMKMGAGIFNLNETMLNKIPVKTMSKALGRVKKTLDKMEAKEKKRASNGLSSDVSEADQATKAARKASFYGAAKDAIISIREAASTSTAAPSRKRRSTTYSALTCADLKKMGSGVTTLTTAQLNIDDSTFTSCYATLGTVTGWSSEQKTQLSTTAKRVWGAASTWTASRLLQVGTIAQGLTDSDLSTITYTTDTVSSLGKYSGWTSTQLSSIFGKWLTDVKSGSVSSITSSELQSLGDVTCGATTSQIGTVAVASYKSAASQVGSLLCNSEGQLQAWAAVAKNAAAFGAVSTWDASTIASVGTVIGGLSAAEIGQLSSTQIEAISSTTISSMPTSAFSGFTSSQLSGMTTTQVRGISSTQAASLSGDAQSTLNSNSDYVSGNSSGSESVRISMAIICAVVVRAFIV